jgi:predicted MFS family arabinose efflux permease
MNKTKTLFVLGMAGFIVTAVNLVVSPILPAIAHSIHSDIARAGLLITAYMLPFGIFQVIYGPLADRFGKKQVIAFALSLFTLATGLCSLGKTIMSLILFRALTGIFAAAIIPISFALIGDIFPAQERQGAIGSFLGLAFLGQGFSMIIGGVIAYLLSWRGVFITYAILSLVPTLLFLTNYSRLPGEKQPQRHPFAPFKILLGETNHLLTYLVILLEGLFILGSFSFIGSYISHVYHFNNLLIGTIMTVFGVMTVVGGRLTGKLALRMGARRLLSCGLTIAALANLTIYFSGRYLFLLVLGTAELGLGFVLAHSTLLNMATEFSPMARGAAMSLVAFFFMSAGGIGTAIGGLLIAKFGLELLFLIYGLALLLTLLLSQVVIKKQETIQVKMPSDAS